MAILDTMCGRYVSVRSDDDILREFDAIEVGNDDAFEPDYNIAPTDPVRAIVNRPLRDADGNPEPTPTRQLRVLRWGLVPSWSKDTRGAARMINARVESVPDKPAFRRAYAKRRCLIPADGWYEWQRLNGPDGPIKQPLYMHAEDDHLLAFAGLYEFWGERGSTITTCAIITAPSTGRLAEVHDRMPLLVPRAGWARWLDPSVEDPADLLRPWDEANDERLELRPVAPLVNKVDNDGPELIAPAEPVAAPQTLF
jgi:putative SOS response-associated peptidase YedK